MLPDVVGRTLALTEPSILSGVVLMEFVVSAHVALADHARQLVRTPNVVQCVNRIAALVMIVTGAASLIIR